MVPLTDFTAASWSDEGQIAPPCWEYVAKWMHESINFIVSAQVNKNSVSPGT